MKVSVVIPTYDRHNDLAELMESLLNQTVKPLEIVVVDDTPTAEIKQLCWEYETEFARVGVVLVYFKNPGERSLAFARNLGVKIAREEIILFVDSDVILYPDYIEKVVETFGKHPEAVGVAGWIIGSTPMKGTARVLARRDALNQGLKKLFMLFHSSRNSCKYFEYPSVLTKIIYCSWSSGSSSAYKRSIFDELTFDENLKQFSYMEDFLFSSLIQKKYPGRLLMTPSARLIHKKAKEGREIPAKLSQIKLRNRKYVLTKLWGSRGLLMFGWQNLGLWIFRILAKIRGWSASALPAEE